jgi:hypothetical protein
MNISRSTFSNNAASGTTGSSGGAIELVNSAKAFIYDSTFYGNTASTGGGGAIEIGNGSLTLVNSTLSGNSTTTGEGGAIKAPGSYGSITLRYVTITGNSGGAGAGGIDNGGATTSVIGSVIANQTTGGDCVGTLSSGGYNLESGTSCGFTQSGDVQNTDPLLGALADNGGPTLTHLPGSPALDLVPSGVAGCGTTYSADQRGVARPQGSGCDLGAAEL